jgi:sulfotransferase
MKKTIYLTGLPRAMTTLMANTLANNPRISGGETSPMLEYLYGGRNNFSNTPEVKSALTEEIMKEAFLNFCREGINGYSEIMCKQKNAEIYLDKSRGWVHYAPFLWEIQPNAKIIVMVRDIRAVLASLEKKWRDNPSIIDNRDNPAQQQFITIDQRVNHWLNDPPLGIALKRIFNAITTGTIKNMLVIRAEEFCKKPKDIMQKVYDFIEEPYFDLDYSNVQQVTVENDRISDFGIYGDHTIKSDIQPLKKDFDEVLGTQISQSVKANYKWFYDAFDYF